MCVRTHIDKLTIRKIDIIDVVSLLSNLREIIKGSKKLERHTLVIVIKQVKKQFNNN
jgi:hypothetical protein